MSGHSKWSTIRHKKAVKDARKGKLFTKLIREITVAARLGGGDVNSNPRLRTAVQMARQNSMPSENIERAIKKGTGELEGESYEEVVYEGYGPGGVAVLLTCLTDNKNRTVAEIRKLFERHGGSLGESNCVAWMFRKTGVLTVDRSKVDEERLIEVALEAGASDVVEADEYFEVLTPPEAFEAVRTAMEEAGIPVESAEVTMRATGTVSVTGKEAEQTLRLLEALEEHDDVQSVASNFDIPREEMERLSA
ncbi:MAG: putative transcriptional regulatory protein [Candidatus Binatia bacterium]|nr:MAG: putative transcriptional regulatory protein [Candidatus Binatia bacterium]